MTMIVFLLACSEEVEDTVKETSSSPLIQHQPPTEDLISGAPTTFTVSAQDLDGITEIILHHKRSDEAYWTDMSFGSGQGASDVTLSADVVPFEPGITYYFRVTDQQGSTSFYPKNGAAEPIELNVLPLAETLPFEEDFSLEEGEQSLIDLNWWNPSDQRESFAFYHTSSEGVESGSEPLGCAVHPRGMDGLPELSDWLISPPLDFSDSEGAMVRWSELIRGEVDLANHELHISTGARLPEEGDYELVTALTPSSDLGVWSKHNFVDLSNWAGNSAVYLAWRWQGSNADDWHIDDVEVIPLAPDLKLTLDFDGPNPSEDLQEDLGNEDTAEPIEEPAESVQPRVLPGEELSFELVVENMTSAEASTLSLSVSLPNGGGVLTPTEHELDIITGGEELRIPISLELSEDVPNHRYLPIEFNLSMTTVEGVDLSWQLSERILVGEPSLVRFSLSMPDIGTMDAFVGVGAPDSPNWSQMVFSGSLEGGLHTFAFDVTEYEENLPPVAGPERWFLSLRSSQRATVSDAAIVSHEQVYEHSELLFLESEIQSVLFPQPPDPILYSLSPSELGPGEYVNPSVLLSNEGASFSGPVNGQILVQGSGVSSFSSDSFLLDSEWIAQEIISVALPEIQVDPQHKNNQPITLFLQLQDDIEMWSIPLTIDVPWPIFKVLGIDVLDDGNGVLEPNEESELEIQIANVGGLNAFGPVSGTLSVDTQSTGLASVDSESVSFGFLDVGESEEEDEFSIVVNGGSEGDIIGLVLDLSDGTETYQDQFQIVLGEAPWLSLSAFDDATGDSLSSTALDLIRVEHRYFEGQLELRITTSNTIDNTGFIEIWGSSGGASYDFYRWVYQSGSGSLQGYSAGFSSIATLDIEQPQDNVLILRWDPSVMGLGQNSLRMGLASGWCGPPSYFCDHFPEGWGYPYVSYDDADWFLLQWSE